MNSNYEESLMLSHQSQALAERCFPVLLWIQTGMLGVHILNAFAAGRVYADWIFVLTAALTAAVLFRLGSVNGKYRKAAFLQCALLAAALGKCILGGSILATAVSVLGIGECYQEYYAHGQTASACHAESAGKWEKLLLWKLVAELFLSLLFIGAEAAGIFRGSEIPVLSGWVQSVFSCVKILVQIFYLENLRQTYILIRRA